MPELPEVEALAEFLREEAVGRTVTRVDAVAISALKTFQPPITDLAGRTIAAVGRYGKFLDLTMRAQGSTEGSAESADDLHLIVHLARAGWLRWSTSLAEKPPRPGKGPLAVRVHLGDGVGFDLTEAGTQKRLATYVVTDPALVPGVSRLGPDPLADEFTEQTLGDILKAAGRAQLKGILTDQARIAGIGNAYSDEILHAARLSPFKPANGLSAAETATLYSAIRSVLTDAAVRARGLAAKDLKAEKKTNLAVHGRTGQPCPVCGDTVREVSFADSSLQYCPTCQTGGKPLADRRLSRLLK
ncbi:Fpg/Nei family DNA glycosylase [Actinopolymorpha singaporensis]|uniref:DNA-(Apurinic or apyrimidinic site) lyase /Formamidopyrimidine-DNA glycosylase n=1 Tax=Actinopolymorpha singaporensis TaxID=117157 RepID=A0A1H1NCU7_9ACTN|nr:DNA-formamidopyrimidine glycosylase family protein [Actinopolymorpha singaporensis]SDR96774.1 DNA-(apurinic or apyrimidinic site) lyase /Formamidopyrimidine-DNA glycosylase [Actinopolymorpha singaporensis]